MDQIAVVTGGAGGMGLATARALAADHQVVLADRDQEAVDAAVRALGDAVHPDELNPSVIIPSVFHPDVRLQWPQRCPGGRDEVGPDQPVTSSPPRR